MSWLILVIRDLKKIHSKTQMPKKKSKKNPLTYEDKKNNQQISRERVLNENVIGNLKRFKILSDCYRNRLKEIRSSLQPYRWNLQFGIGKISFERSLMFANHFLSSCLKN